MAKLNLGAVFHKRTRTPNLILNILVELTRVVFDLESMATDTAGRMISGQTKGDR